MWVMNSICGLGLQLKNEIEYDRDEYNTIANECITANRVKCWFVKCMFHLYTQVRMNVLSNDSKCISTEGQDQKNVKPLINIRVFLFRRVLSEQFEDLLCTGILILSTSN